MRLKAGRMAKPEHVADAFNGEGAARYPGRWNEARVPMVYLSSTLPLAAWEMYVHLDNLASLTPYKFLAVGFDKKLCAVHPLPSLPAGWDDNTIQSCTRIIGTRWAHSLSSVVLAVPSAIFPTELNYLVNPRHPDFSRLKINEPISFEFDRRLVK